jgi:serine/threonine-protein kinase ATR
MNESLQFLGVERPTFLRQNYAHILPHAVLQRDADLIRHAFAAGDNEGNLGTLLVNHNADILAEVFTREHDSKLRDTLKFYRGLVQGDNDTQVTIPRLITLCVAPLLVRMIVRLCKSESSDAILKALQRVHQFGHPEQRRQSSKQDVIIFLKQHMLGIISELNDMLHDMHEKKTIKQKLEVISSYEALICLAGSTMAVYSPQASCAILMSSRNLTDFVVATDPGKPAEHNLGTAASTRNVGSLARLRNPAEICRHRPIYRIHCGSLCLCLVGNDR